VSSARAGGTLALPGDDVGRDARAPGTLEMEFTSGPVPGC
jgi:hypothetical protein